MKAIEFRPSARSVVHHSLFFLDDSGEARKLDGQDGQPGFKGMRARIAGRLGGYVPGNTPAFLPERSGHADAERLRPRLADALPSVGQSGS